MKLVVQVKLLPTPEQAMALDATLRACNAAAAAVSERARALGCFRNYDLRRNTYHDIKARHRLGAQAAQHVIKKVCDAYTTLHANLTAGHYGRPGSQRRSRVEATPISFRTHAAQPYDARMLSWQHDARTVSIWTTAGRRKGVAFTGSPDQLTAVATRPVGEYDLVHRDGMWFLYATTTVDEPEVYEPAGFLGVDLGIANIAYDSDGTGYIRDAAQPVPAPPAAPAAAVAGQAHRLRAATAGQTT